MSEKRRRINNWWNDNNTKRKNLGDKDSDDEKEYYYTKLDNKVDIGTQTNIIEKINKETQTDDILLFNQQDIENYKDTIIDEIGFEILDITVPICEINLKKKGKFEKAFNLCNKLQNQIFEIINDYTKITFNV